MGRGPASPAHFLAEAPKDIIDISLVVVKREAVVEVAQVGEPLPDVDVLRTVEASGGVRFQ